MKRLIRLLPLLLLLLLCACGQDAAEAGPTEIAWDSLTPDHSMELRCADQFSVDYYEGGYKAVTIAGTDSYLVVPADAAVPTGIPADMTVLQQPLDHIYLVATSAMDLFRELDAVGAVTLSGTDAAGWYIAEAREAMEAGRMTYAGKYSAPDYELILSQGCDLAVESTMIYHTPEVQEQLERFGIPVLVERSSYERHPLGRMEWIKLYAALLDKEAEAEAFFDRQMETLAPILEQENTGKTVALFYITSAGAVNVRKPGDYIAKSIGLAGGVYLPQDTDAEDNALSTMNMQMEAFYAAARDADVLIYNSTIDGELETMDDLLAKSELLADFKAVETGNVWCTGKNLFQESLGLGDLIADLHAILTEENPETVYLHRLS